jgi:hypothetical protein
MIKDGTRLKYDSYGEYGQNGEITEVVYQLRPPLDQCYLLQMTEFISTGNDTSFYPKIFVMSRDGIEILTGSSLWNEEHMNIYKDVASIPPGIKDGTAYKRGFTGEGADIAETMIREYSSGSLNESRSDLSSGLSTTSVLSVEPRSSSICNDVATSLPREDSGSWWYDFTENNKKYTYQMVVVEYENGSRSKAPAKDWTKAMREGSWVNSVDYSNICLYYWTIKHLSKSNTDLLLNIDSECKTSYLKKKVRNCY